MTARELSLLEGLKTAVLKTPNREDSNHEALLQANINEALGNYGIAPKSLTKGKPKKANKNTHKRVRSTWFGKEADLSVENSAFEQTKKEVATLSVVFKFCYSNKTNSEFRDLLCEFLST